MIILGITGGIATGKSTVTQILASFGAPIISADALAHRLLAPGMPTTKEVLTAFPECADPVDLTLQTLDRRALGRLVFSDPTARLRLESLTHPAIIAALIAQREQWRNSKESRAGAAEIPLLFEAGLEAYPDQIIVAACTEDVQIARLKVRLGIDVAEAGQIIAAQWPLAQKIARASVVISTDGTLEDTRHQVQELWNSL